jgi:cell division initiation protein
MLTPQDLQEVSFEKAKIGGYVMKSVDEFLEPLMDDYVALYKENAVLKSKMRLLVERLETYRANEAAVKTAAEQAKKDCEAMLADARRRSEEIVSKANQEARTASHDADAAVTAESDRLRRAKEATADFVRAVEAELARQQQALEALKSLDLPAREAKPARRAYDYEAEQDRPAPRPEPAADTTEDIAAQIEQSVATITGDTPRPKPEPRPDPKAATKVMPALDERTTAKFANLKFGKNYQP